MLDQVQIFRHLYLTMFVPSEFSNNKTALSIHINEGTIKKNFLTNAMHDNLLCRFPALLWIFKKAYYKCNLLSHFDVWGCLLPPDFWFVLNIHFKFHEGDKLYETTHNNFSENCTFEDPILFFHATLETVSFLITKQFPKLFEISLPKEFFFPEKLLAVI